MSEEVKPEETKTEETKTEETKTEEGTAAAEKMFKEKEEGKTADDAGKDKTLLTGDESDKAKDEDSKGEDKAKADESAKKDETPGAFGEFTIPEGMILDETAMEAFTPIAKELGLTQDQAQKLVDVYSNANADAEANFSEQIDALHEGWIQEVKDDSEIGGAKFDESVAMARHFLNGYGDQKLIEILNETGMGNHPAIVRLFWNFDKLVKEDAISNFGNTGGSAPDKTVATTLFPSMTKGE